MSNLRRHFNFSAKPSTLSPESDVDNLPVQFDKHNLMNNICSCLDICCSYIQTLNALCGAGSLLARNLLQTVQNVPAYQHVAQQFLCVWDEVGKATAGASAAVKTETLMVLQEVLNSLEVSSTENGIDNSFAENFQVIGSCLHSFIELQAQFSMSTWKSLSKLSKSFSNDAFNWKSNDRSSLKVVKNSELCSTIKKHYSHLLHKYDMHKNVDSPEVQQSQFYIAPGVVNNPLSHAHVPQSESFKNDSTNTVVWSPSTTLWSTASDVKKEPPLSSPTSLNRTPADSATANHPVELDEVINLLSCMPFEQFPAAVNTPVPASNQGSYNPSQSYQFWQPGAGPILSRHLNQHRLFSERNRDINFGYDSWIWRSDNMNCSELANRFDEAEVKGGKESWQHAELPFRWNVGAGESSSDDTSSNQGPDLDSSNQSLFTTLQPRRYSSSDGLPEALEILPDSEDRPWTVQNHKTSTWPLKQSSSRFLTGFDWPDGMPQSKFLPMYYTSNS